MNSDSLLNIINVIIKNEEKFEEFPNEIYGLFKKHGYEGDIETLKLDLKNLLNDVIKSDEELSKVAGGKVSKLAAGAVAALTCFPMKSFASGTANTSQNENSAVNKITDAIKSGAKKVGDATKEYVIEPAKDVAKTIARNPGKSAAVAGALVAYGLLTGLAGKSLASPPKVETQGMTGEEKQTVEETYQVLHELADNFYVVIEGKEIENKEYSWDLNKLEKKPGGLSENNIKIGGLVEQLMPEKIGSNPPTEAYTQIRKAYIAYEKAQLKTLEKSQQELDKKKPENVEQLENENKALKQKLESKDNEIKQKEDEIEKQKTANEKKLKQKEDELKAKTKEYKESLAKMNDEIEKQKTANEKKLKQKEDELKAKTKEYGEKIAQMEEKVKEKKHEYDDMLNRKNAEQEQQKKEYAQQIAELEETTARMEKTEKKLTEKEEEVKELQTRNATLESTTNQLEQQIKQLEDDISKRNENLDELTNTLDQLQPTGNKIKPDSPLLPNYVKPNSILATIKTALAKLKIDYDKLQTSLKTGGKSAYARFWRISKSLATGKPVSEEQSLKLDGTKCLGLAQILLTPSGQSPAEYQDNSKLAPLTPDALNLNISQYKTNRQLRQAANASQTWKEWLKPKKPFLGHHSGLANNLVLEELPSLILAAVTLNSPKTLTALLTALENLLIADVSSDYRGAVNTMLERVGMRFDDKICKLVSTTKTTK